MVSDRGVSCLPNFSQYTEEIFQKADDLLAYIGGTNVTISTYADDTASVTGSAEALQTIRPFNKTVHAG